MKTVGQVLQRSLMPMLLLLFLAAARPAHGQDSNLVTFENQSGEFALVILVGPTSRNITILPGWTRTVRVPGGAYYIVARYGLTPKRYRYIRGEAFEVPASSSSCPPIQITLGRVTHGGDCFAQAITPEEFRSALNLQVRTASN